jgi:tetratricopeptide (TPR) repeat protein
VSAVAALLPAVALLAATPQQPEPSPTPNADPNPKTAADVHPATDELPPLEAIEAWVRGHPRDARALLALGHVRIAQNQTDAAARALFAAASYAQDPAIAARAYYALGVAELQGDALERARDAFFDALAINPADRNARFNLEWTLLALDEQPTEPPRPDSSSDDSGPGGKSPDQQGPEDNDPRPAELPYMQEAQEEPSPRLSEAQRLRSLSRVHDDLSRAIRAAARADTSIAGRQRPGPAW